MSETDVSENAETRDVSENAEAHDMSENAEAHDMSENAEAHDMSENAEAHGVSEQIMQAIRDKSNLTGSTLDEICDHLISQGTLNADTAKVQVTETIQKATAEGLIGKMNDTNKYVVLERFPSCLELPLTDADHTGLNQFFNILVAADLMGPDLARMYKALIVGSIQGLVGKLEGTNRFVLLDQGESHSSAPASRGAPQPARSRRGRRKRQRNRRAMGHATIGHTP